MIKIYIEKEHAPDVPLSPVFWPNFRFAISPKRLFLAEILAQYTEPFFTVVERPEEADFFAVPYEYFFLADQRTAYLSSVYEKARTMGKKVLLFDYTDYVDRRTHLPPHAVLFRVSAYRHHRKENEIIMPYFVEDMGARYGLTPKEKKAECAIGYCGQSRFKTVTRELRARLKWFFFSLRLRFCGDREPSVHQRGIFWRSRALNLLRRAGAELLIKERSFYSLHGASLIAPPSAIRAEYIENLRASDIALCTRGDANASQRFYEVLSAGRVPLFLDTDCVLPLEEIIAYDDIIFRVDARDIRKLPEKIRHWWQKETPEAFRVRGMKAQEVYRNYLRMDRFFERVFDRETSPYKALLFS